VVDLEDPQPVQQIVTPVGEGIQAGAQDHILAHPIGGRLLDDVLGNRARTHIQRLKATRNG